MEFIMRSLILLLTKTLISLMIMIVILIFLFQKVRGWLWNSGWAVLCLLDRLQHHQVILLVGQVRHQAGREQAGHGEKEGERRGQEGEERGGQEPRTVRAKEGQEGGRVEQEVAGKGGVEQEEDRRSRRSREKRGRSCLKVEELVNSAWQRWKINLDNLRGAHWQWFWGGGWTSTYKWWGGRASGGIRWSLLCGLW